MAKKFLIILLSSNFVFQCNTSFAEPLTVLRGANSELLVDEANPTAAKQLRFQSTKSEEDTKKLISDILKGLDKKNIKREKLIKILDQDARERIIPKYYIVKELDSLASFYFDNNDINSEIKIRIRIRKILISVLGQEHRAVISETIFIADSYLITKEVNKAEVEFDYALKWAKEESIQNFRHRIQSHRGKYRLSIAKEDGVEGAFHLQAIMNLLEASKQKKFKINEIKILLPIFDLAFKSDKLNDALIIIEKLAHLESTDPDLDLRTKVEVIKRKANFQKAVGEVENYLNLLGQIVKIQKSDQVLGKVDYVEILDRMGQTYVLIGKPINAINILNEAIDILLRDSGDQSERLVSLYFVLGAAHLDLGDRQQYIAAHARAETIKSKLIKERSISPELSSPLSNFSSVLSFRAENFESGITQARAALALSRDIVDNEFRNLCYKFAAYSLVRNLNGAGRFEEAKVVLDEIDRRDSNFPSIINGKYRSFVSKSSTRAQFLLARAETERGMGNFANGRSLVNQVVDGVQKTGQKLSIDHINHIFSIFDIFLYDSEYDRASFILDLIEKSLPPAAVDSSLLHARLLRAKASLKNVIGEFEIALQYINGSIDIANKLGASRSMENYDSQLIRSYIKAHLGLPLEGIDLLLSFASNKEVVRSDSAWLRFKSAVGYLAIAEGDSFWGKELLSDVVSKKRELSYTDPGSFVLDLNNLAVAYGNIGENRRQETLLNEAFYNSVKNFGLHHPTSALILGNLARTSNLSIELKIALLKQAVNIYQGTRERIAMIGERELSIYTDRVKKNYQELADLLIKADRLDEASLVLSLFKDREYFDFTRRSLDSSRLIASIPLSKREEIWSNSYTGAARDLVELSTEYERLLGIPPIKRTKQQNVRFRHLNSKIQAARRDFYNFLDRLRDSFAAQGLSRKDELSDLSKKSLTDVREILGSLGGDSALLQIYLLNDRAVFLLSTSSTQIARELPIDYQGLRRDIFEFRRLLADRFSDPVPSAHKLYSILFAPIVKDLNDLKVTNLMLSLDGILRYIPYGALHDGNEFIVRRWNMPIYTSTARFRLLESNSPEVRIAGLGTTKKMGNFIALPAVKDELLSIVRKDAAGTLLGEIYLDEHFTAERFRSVSNSKFPIVHVASHFRLSPGTEINSFLLLGDGSRLTLGEIRSQNYRFDGVELLTLSACETGLGGGKDNFGREIEGFGVIAQQQGAKAVLATLWQVADGSTATLMSDMYRRRTSYNLSKIEALRQAQIALSAQARTAHPFYWAPFVLMGNWR